MMHLISINGKSARDFYLVQRCISDFKSLMRTVTSGRVMIISTKFRSDLFYNAEEPKKGEILKLWALYANAELSLLTDEEIKTSMGDEESLSTYFQSINHLAANWLEYSQYKKAFYYSYWYDQKNPMAARIVQCDQFLIQDPGIHRPPLCDACEKQEDQLTEDTLALAMRILNNGTHSN